MSGIDRAPQWFQVKLSTTLSLGAIALVLGVAIALSLGAKSTKRKINAR